MKTLAPDSTTAGYQKVDVFSVAATAQTARDLGAQLDSATSKVGIGDNAIGSGELATTAVAEILHYKIDTVTLSDSSIAGFAYMALKPTTALRKLDVSSTGEAGVDWANIGSPTTTVNLSGTTIATTQQVNATKIGGTTQTGIDIGSYLPAAMDSVMLSNGYRAGQKAIFKVSANLDTLYIYSRDGSTLLFRTVFVHPGGSPGDPPDTSRSVGP
jgi:hypothetical protein